MITLLFLLLFLTSAAAFDSSNLTDPSIEILNSTNFTEFSNTTELTTTISPLNESSVLDVSNFTECQYTSGLESRFSEMLITHPSYVDCDFTKNHSCYSIVSDFDNSLIQLGCERNIICGSSVEDHCFQHSTGYLCCCRTNNCNNYSHLHLKLEDSGFKDEFVLYEWWHFPLFILSTFTLLCLFATILAVLFVIKNIINLSNDEEKLDKKLLSKIRIQQLEVIQENRKVAHANADVAVQQFYQFLKSRKLVEFKKSCSKAKSRPEYVSTKLRLRSITSLQKLVSESSDLKIFNVKENKDL